MNQCFSEHAHYGLIAGARSVSLALVENGEERERDGKRTVVNARTQQKKGRKRIIMNVD